MCMCICIYIYIYVILSPPGLACETIDASSNEVCIGLVGERGGGGGGYVVRMYYPFSL